MTGPAANKVDTHDKSSDVNDGAKCRKAPYVICVTSMTMTDEEAAAVDGDTKVMMTWAMMDFG